MTELQSKTLEILELMTDVFVIYGLDVFGAIVILIVGWMASGWGRMVVQKALAKTNKVDAMVQAYVSNSTKYAILVFTILAVLDQFGLETTSFIAVLGAAGLAIGLALQGTLSNLAAGVMILIFRPFKIGEFIEGAGQSGTVKSVSLFLTYLNTSDNVVIILPNAQLWNAAIKNYSLNKTRRLDLMFGIGYRDDIDQAIVVINKILAADDRCHNDPATVVVVGNLGESSVDIIVRTWCASSDYSELKWGLLKTIKQRFDAEKISIPYPQREVHLIGANDK